MQHAPMTEMDRAVWIMKAPLETENAYKDADRTDASIMRSAQRYYFARVIATMGKLESEAVQVR